jgi:hypothetical protein
MNYLGYRLSRVFPCGLSLSCIISSLVVYLPDLLANEFSVNMAIMPLTTLPKDDV